MLAIQKHIIEYGLEATVEKFRLDVKDYGHKVLLKYKQVESPMSEPEVQDARGLVLRKSDWSVMSLAFRKFFNLGEGKGEALDWSTARMYEKMDGTLIHVYYDDVLKKVCFGTTGTAEGEGPVDNFHWGAGDIGTFADLFWKAYFDTSAAYRAENPESNSGFYTNDTHVINYDNREQAFVWFSGFTLAFELCTPHNIVVTPHSDYRVYLLGARDLKTLEEIPSHKLPNLAASLNVYMPKTFEFSNVEDLQHMVATQPFSMEGVVVCDANFNRRKVKNPAYVAVHFMRDATAYWRIVDVVRSGEIDEYLAYFPGREAEVRDIEQKWIILNGRLEGAEQKVEPIAEKLKTLDVNSDEYKACRREAALMITELSNSMGIKQYSSHLFSMLGSPRPPAEGEVRERTRRSVKDYLMSCDGKDMFDNFKKWK